MSASVAYRFENKSVLVTGSSRGIGFEIARSFLASGARVAVNGRDAARLQAAVTSLEAGLQPQGPAGRLHAAAGDVRQWNVAQDVVNSAAAAFDGLDVLVNNAGGNFYCPLEDLSPNGWHATLDANLTSAFLCAKAAFKHLRVRGGVIVNIASVAAFAAHPGRAAYAAAKAGLVSLTKSMAHEWARHGIRAVCIAPGAVATETSRFTDEATRADVLARVPLGRLGTAADVARACLFVASEDAAYITGAVLRVDGGPKIAV